VKSTKHEASHNTTFANLSSSQGLKNFLSTKLPFSVYTMFLTQDENNFSRPYQTTNNIIILHILDLYFRQKMGKQKIQKWVYKAFPEFNLFVASSLIYR
jgi:hypothetical protein